MATDVTYQLRVQGHLEAEWEDWYGGLKIANEPNGQATLTVPVRDQAALHGVLNRVFGLNLTLISVSRVEQETQLSGEAEI